MRCAACWTGPLQFDLMCPVESRRVVCEVEKPIAKSVKKAASGPVGRRAGDIFLFMCVIAVSCLAVIVVALAAPFVLAASAVAGLFSKGAEPRGWRPAGA